MILDARNGCYPYTVYHAERCEVLKNIQWVDDATAQWCEILVPIQLLADGVVTRVHQARKIVIYLERRLVIIDPIDDSEPERQVVEAIGLVREAA